MSFLLQIKYLMLRFPRLKYINLLLQCMEPASTRKDLQNNKKLLDDLIKRRNIYFQGIEIYGGCAGLYDLGPIGSAIKNNLEQVWRDHFILEEDLFEINTTCILPEVVLENSGHVAKFTDLMVKDVKTGQGSRADKLITEWVENKMNKDKAKLKEEEVQELKKVLTYVESMSKEEINQVIKKYKIKNPETGNQFGPAEPFNLMFQTQIGPSGNSTGYLRPETAQGMFLNFSKLLDYNGGRMPFGAAQIGLGFRNEIAPRSGLIRVREFTMAEIEYFIDPKNKNHPKFKRVQDVRLPLLSAKTQEALKDEIQWIEIGKAVENGIVANETIAYFMARIYLFLKDIGVNVNDHVRLRQHKSDEMAHYAADCWDAEIEMSSGWVECIGCADRSAFDLEHHAKGSGQKMVASRKFKEAIPEKQTIVNVKKQVVGKQFKKDSQAINKHLDSLEEPQKAQLKTDFETNGEIVLEINGNKFVLKNNHVDFEEKVVNVSEEKYVPNVIEPSFGMGRVLTAVLEHSFKMRDEKRTYLVLKPKIAPVKVSILPLQYDQRFFDIIAEIRAHLKKRLVSCKIDDSGQSIGKRYSRTDEIGIPFGITVDYKTLEDRTITLRELHTMKQMRIPMADIDKVVCQLALEQISWADISKEYPQFVSESNDD